MFAESGDEASPAARASGPASLLGPAELAAYEHLVFHPEWSHRSLAAALNLGLAAVPELLETLHRHQLARPSQQDSERLVAVSPAVGLGRLAGDAEQELLEHSHYVHRLRLLATSLTERYERERADRVHDSGSEVVLGRDAAVIRVGELLRDCVSSVDSAVPSMPTRQALEQARAGDEGVLARGVRVRALFQQAQVRQSKPLREHLQWLIEHGAQVRVTSVLPVRLMLFDDQVAALAVDPSHPGSGALVLDRVGAVHALSVLFDLLWDAARVPSSGAAPTGTDRVLTDIEDAVLRQLARGNKDEAISRRTGVSVRSVRRTIASLMETMNAGSRFELALRCRERGLV